jgi:WD40 repeat protein
VLEDDYRIAALTISPDARRLAAIATYTHPVTPEGDSPPPQRDHYVRLWDLTTGKLMDTPMPAKKAVDEQFPPQIRFSPDGRVLVYSFGAWPTATWGFWRIDGTDFTRVAEMATNTINRIEFSADGRTLIGSGLSSVRLWDVHQALPLPSAVDE